MPRPKVLLVTSGHPAIRPGGLEHYSLDLYEALRRSERVEPLLLARAGPLATEATPNHDSSPWCVLTAPAGRALTPRDRVTWSGQRCELGTQVR